mmetsp:Transcript_129202/g.257974  ORF Transcript_129202/g.257974 Transcript_129202/m.257974 type:complete len:376 (-) Transcript_129202:82-1209(-)
MGAACNCGEVPVQEEIRENEDGATGPDMAFASVPDPADLKPKGPDTRKFTLILHGAHLDRSFAKVGWMDPYALVIVNGEEVERTAPHKGAHKEPHWNVAHTWSAAEVPDNVKVAIWDKNNFHRDVFCGSVTVPCSMDMGDQAEKGFTLTKREEPTGVLTLTLKVEGGDTQEEQPNLDRRTISLGMELDALVEFSRPRSRSNTLVQLQEFGDEADMATPITRKLSKKIDDSGGEIAPSLIGSWKCVETHGLEDFLKATGVGVFQRKIALAAKWPGWEYKVVDKKLLFINHSAIGDLEETTKLGEEYDWKDGHKNPFKCLATWANNDKGGVLTIKRTGAVGNYQEIRVVNGDTLDFSLIHEKSGVTWGRKFAREPNL